jgi:serine/threonine protein kinase
MDTMRLCAQCRAPLTADATGPLCPNCQRTPTGIASVPAPPGAAPCAPPPAAQIAEFFPQLEVYELLGLGGMGMVYKARQVNLDRLVALKILSPELSSQPAFAERFSREAKALARLHHSNIVSVYDFGRAGPYYYFLMEYVDGVDLHTLIQQKALKPPEILRIVVEICQALQFAHEEGIIHRDIKPANILLDKKGRVKMADFGLAKLAGTDGQRLPALTLATGLMGTPQYMAPEQIEKPSEVDQRADLYSLGVVFYEMLTGELPLGRFPLPSQIAHTDARLDQVVLRALEKEPDRRYQQASEILTQVEAFSAPATAAVRSRKMAVVYQIGIVCALALVAVLAFALFHSLANPRIITHTVTNTVTVASRGRGPYRGGNPGNNPFIRGDGMEPFEFPPNRGGNPGNNPFLTNTTEGLSLTPPAVSELQLSPEQVQVVNAVLHTTSQDFSQIQSNYVSHSKDASGHVHVTVKPLTEADVARVRTLREQMWKELGGVFTPAQLDMARQLPGEPFDRRVLPLNTHVTEFREMWRDKDGQYHSLDDMESILFGGIILSNASTNLDPIIPPQYQSLLK